MVNDCTLLVGYYHHNGGLVVHGYSEDGSGNYAASCSGVGLMDRMMGGKLSPTEAGSGSGGDNAASCCGQSDWACGNVGGMQGWR